MCHFFLFVFKFYTNLIMSEFIWVYPTLGVLSFLNLRFVFSTFGEFSVTIYLNTLFISLFSLLFLELWWNEY